MLGLPLTHGLRSARAQVDVKVFRAIQDDIAGRTPQLRDRKLEPVRHGDRGVNAGRGPDLLGVCEVENRFVIDLVNATRRG